MKNYISLLFILYIVIISTKFIFITYLSGQFIEFSTQELIYAAFWGYKFDLAASAIVAFIISLFNFNKKLFATLGAVSIISVFLTQVGDILYFDDAGRHVGYEVIDIIVDANSLFMTALTQHTSITIGALLLALVLYIIFYNVLKNLPTTPINKYFFLQKVLLLILSIFFIRGMFQHIPLHPWQSNEIGNSKLAMIALNPTYNIIYSLANKKKKLSKAKLPKIDKDTLKKSVHSMYSNTQMQTDLPVIKTKPNIVLLFSESWSAKFMSAYGFKGKTTPVYDELLKKSLAPTFMVANGHRTTEGIFASLTSFQNPLGQTIAKTQLQNFQYDSIIYELTKKGYQSAFFQGSSKDTSGTGSLASNLGFEKSYGKRDIKIREFEENYWGVHDSDVYNFIIEKIDTKELNEPFVIGFNGASTHDSVVPKGFPTFNFTDDGKLNKKLSALHYADHALGKFIEEVEAKYPNTIFILFSDHCGGSVVGSLENYMIPFAIYSKKLIQPKQIPAIMSQRDIAPTLYELTIGSLKESNLNFTGKSLVNTKKFYADYFHNGILGWVENNTVVETNVTTGQIHCFNINKFTKEKTQCLPQHEQMKTRALSFSNLSQKLLFEGKTKEFNQFK